MFASLFYLDVLLFSKSVHLLLSLSVFVEPETKNKVFCVDSRQTGAQEVKRLCGFSSECCVFVVLFCLWQVSLHQVKMTIIQESSRGSAPCCPLSAKANETVSPTCSQVVCVFGFCGNGWFSFHRGFNRFLFLKTYLREKTKQKKLPCFSA